MTWPPNDPNGSPADDQRRPPLTGPTEGGAPWLGAPPPPIPSYSPPPVQAPGPQDSFPQYGYGAPRPPQQQLRYADWGERVGATLVDWMILLVPILVFSEIFENLATLLWLAAAGWIAWLNGSKGQSPGKALMGLKVIRDVDGDTLGGPVGVVRSLALLLMLPFTAGIVWGLSLVWPLWDPKKQALHDKIVGATVVAGYPRQKLGKAIFKP